MYVLDIETTTEDYNIRLIGLMDCKTEVIQMFTNPDSLLYAINKITKEGRPIVTWNGTTFDLPVLRKAGVAIPEDLHRDGMVLAQMLFPYRQSHSLDSWTKDLFEDRFHKGVVDYDHAPIEELEKYLRQDLIITWKVYKYLMEQAAKVGGTWKNPLRVEQKVRESVFEQGKRGFPFDVEKADKVYALITTRMNFLSREIRKTLPTAPLPKSKLHWPPKRQFNTDGSVSKHLLNYLEKYGAELRGREVLHDGVAYSLPLTAPLVTHSQIDPGDTNRLKQFLITKGWIPAYWNYGMKDGHKVRTSPRLTNPVTKEPCPGLKSVTDVPVNLISEYLMLQHRQKQLKAGDKGWIPEARSSYGSIKHSANTLGTPTARYTHRKIVNVPRVSSPWGGHLRSLFVPYAGHKMVGWDATALESVIEAHYTYDFDNEYSMMLVAGSSDEGTDIHTRNQKNLGLASRDDAKKFKYAVTYGAGPDKLGREFSWDIKVARKKYEDFWSSNFGLKMLRENLKEEWMHSKKQYITGIDGRKIFVQSEHLLLNYKFQAGGAILMKYASLIALGLARKAKIDAYPLIRYHDEEQWSCNPTEVDELGRIGVQSIEMAGRYLKLKVPITGTYHVGDNWAETH